MTKKEESNKTNSKKSEKKPTDNAQKEVTKEVETPKEVDTSSDVQKETPKEVEALAKTSGESPLVLSLGTNNEAFMEVYGERLRTLESKIPTEDEFEDILEKLPEEAAESVVEFMKRMSGDKEGLFDDNDSPELTELRMYQGTGDDPTRPDKMIPGELYLTTGENLHEEFEGTPIALWKGNTMWAPSDEGSRGAPICQSMDRKMGTSFGPCDACPNRPWKDGDPQQCSHDVSALMLRKNLNDVVLVRFAKTSEPVGRKLNKIVRRTPQLWSKWFKITAAKQVHEKNKNHVWFIWVLDQIPTEEGGRTDKETIHPLCRFMSISMQQTFLLPGIARIYRQAQDNRKPLNETTQETAGSVGPTSESGDTPNYEQGMSDVPQDV